MSSHVGSTKPSPRERALSRSLREALVPVAHRAGERLMADRFWTREPVLRTDGRVIALFETAEPGR